MVVDIVFAVPAQLNIHVNILFQIGNILKFYLRFEFVKALDDP